MGRLDGAGQGSCWSTGHGDTGASCGWAGHEHPHCSSCTWCPWHGEDLCWVFAALQEAALSTAAPGAVFRPPRADSPDAVCALLSFLRLCHTKAPALEFRRLEVSGHKAKLQAGAQRSRYSEQPGAQKQAAFCFSAGSDQNNKYYLGTKPRAK